MQAGLVLLGLSVLVLWHELGHLLAAWTLRLHITDFSAGFGPTLVQKSWSGIRWRIGVIPFGGFVRVRELSLEADEPDRYRARFILRRIIAQLAGSFANFVLATLLVAAAALAWGQPTGAIAGLEVTKVSDHASDAGLRVGDVVERIGDRPIRSVAGLNDALASSGSTVSVYVRRTEGSAQLAMTPLERDGKRGLGARYVARPELRAASPGEALAAGLAYPVSQSRALIRNASAMFVPSSGVRPVGPIGLADRVSQSGSWDVRRVLSFAAMLSVVVGLFNLLPIPGLDGGRLVLELVESVRRKRISIRGALIAQVTGAIVLLALWIVVSVVWDLGG